MSEIGAWLEGLGLGEYAEAFAAADVDGRALPHLTNDDLKELGVTLGHRRIILAAITEGADGASGEDAPPPEPAAPDAERRQVTVLFCDMVGSTALSQKLDPEDLRGVMRAYQDACASAISRYDGHIAQTLGDGLMVYFGFPNAHEDDASRAVRAGLDIVEGVRRLDAGQPVDIAVRVGIHTGLVVAGEVGGADTRAGDAVVGETPNVAARLQGMAKPNTVFVSEANHGLTAGTFSWDDLGNKKAKGVRGGVRVYRPTGATEAESRFEASTAKGVTPLVGRESEITLLLDRWVHAKDGEGQVVLLSGEAGIGKSRIVQVLRERLADEPHTRLRLQCSPYYTNSAFHPLIDQFERAAKFARDASAESKLDRMEELLSVGHDDVQAVAPLYAGMLSIDTGDRYAPLNMSPQRQKEKTIEAIANQTAGIARRGPVLFIFEDAHWADPTTLEVLEAVIGRIESAPVLVVITHRPEFDPPWTQAHITQLALSRLAKSQCSDMVAKVTGGKALPDEVLAQIVAKTDGVPLFVEELTKTVLEAGFLKDAGDHYQLDGPLPPLAIPATLQDSLVARLDRLSPVKEIAQVGAVIGREFSYELLSAVSPMRDNELTAALTELVNSELIFRRGSPPEATYTFKHALVQDTAYESLLKSKRQQLHAAIAKALEERFPETRDGQPELLAHHYARAGLAEQAVPYWLAAGRSAMVRSAHREAIAHLTNGLPLLEGIQESRERDELELELQRNLAVASIGVKGHGSSATQQAWDRAYSLGRKLKSGRLLLPVLWGMSTVHFLRGDIRESARFSGELVDLAESLDDPSQLVLAYSSTATGMNAAGDFAGGRHHAERALALYDYDRDKGLAASYGHDRKAHALQVLAQLLHALGYLAQAHLAASNAIAFARQIAHPQTLALVLTISAAQVHQLRNPNRALDQVEEGLAICAEYGFPSWEVFGLFNRGRIRCALGDPVSGIQDMRSGLEKAEEADTKLARPALCTGLAEVLGRTGQFAEALQLVESSLADAEHRGELSWQAETHRVKGQLLLGHDGADPAAAEASFLKAIDFARGQSAKWYELRASADLARLWQSQGKRTEAHDLLAPVYSWFTEGFDTADLKDAKALLEELA